MGIEIKQKRNTISPFWRFSWQFWIFSNSKLYQKMLICFCCSCREYKSEFKNISYHETIHCEVEVRSEYSIRIKDARRENCAKAVCCFRFGRIWKMTNFICRSKIFSNMGSLCTIFFWCTHWIHTSLQIKNLGPKSKICEIRDPCVMRYTKGIMVDCRQRCSLSARDHDPNLNHKLWLYSKTQSKNYQLLSLLRIKEPFCQFNLTL